jgi:LPS O-antigen subunit length determinant protein (WzzB/FepE family)
MGIDKNTISTQRFSAPNTFVTNVKTDTPFYMRGYIAIEEEIKLIKARKDKSLFMTKLFKLKQEKRKLAQDKTLNRARVLFNKTPINKNDFIATLFKVGATDFETKHKGNLYYVLALVLGGIIGIVFVLITNAFKIRQNIESKS